MELGHCPHCATPYTTSEVTGFGVLRGRPESAGGPRMEYRCQECGRMIHLVAHGEGRYAPPGEPPPPPVPEAERRPPWMSPEAGPQRRRRRPPPPPEPPAAEPEPPPTPAVEVEPAPGVAEALEILGISATADRESIDRAFRERSRTCHPDKVAHLDPEFQELAERKFRRLQQAYLLLTG